MANYKTTRIIPVALTLIAVAVAIAALVSIARVLFFSNGSATINSSQQALLSTDADRGVRMTVRGEIIANENFRSYQINVTPNERTLTVFKGYQDQVLSKVTLVNNIPAYEQFVYALDKANLAKGTELTGDKNDLRGICATGLVYQFQTLKAGESQKQLWTSTCSSYRGSLGTSLSPLTKLFTAQIPNAKSLVGDLWQ